MSDIRYGALQSIAGGITDKTIARNGSQKLSTIFGEKVFNLIAMKEYLSEGTYIRMVDAIQRNARIDFETAENVAKGLKKWATDLGATHYTHWFQPLTGTTAEKHDSFFKPSLDITVQGMENLSAAELVQREPDASSFPHGGLRSTAEARGYTIWDPSSYAFILETSNASTLYIPAVYISYHGESLDFKTPLLKSTELLNRAATEVCHYFDPTVNNVITTLGWEQEYFIVDASLYHARPDLMITGRTLFGGRPARNQQLEDHYFATIPERIQNFMVEFERECLSLGIPVLTRHNEVAPGQYECAPMFEELNQAVDHNLLCMDIMQRVGARLGLKVLFHEKPFAGVNGSGKHNNWSMATDRGKNLLSPGENPGANLQFLTFFINIIAALNENSDILRAGVASLGNEHRLGANEAPPAIISLFTGSQLAETLEEFKENGLASSSNLGKAMIDLGIPKIPEADKDNTDRNRTSPFPFTGNKFEYRAVGAPMNCSQSLTILNTIVAHQLIQFKKDVDKQIQEGKEQQQAIVAVLQQLLLDSERIIFNGDSYSAEWEKEAARRKLPNIKSTPEALRALVTPKAREIFISHGVLNEKELESRYHVFLEQYVKQLEIEVLVCEEMVRTHILPAAFDYIRKLTDNHEGLARMGMDKAADRLREETELVFHHVHRLREHLQLLEDEKNKAFAADSLEQTADHLSTRVKPFLEVIREDGDQLEKLVDDNLWKLPKYRELLFIR
ncbi:MAG: glutamine synthetase III [Candidatus Kapaibacterium sp.]